MCTSCFRPIMIMLPWTDIFIRILVLRAFSCWIQSVFGHMGNALSQVGVVTQIETAAIKVCNCLPLHG